MMSAHYKDVSLRVLRVVEGTTVDGPGLRTSIYLAGCTHQCPGCHNPQSWDARGGEERTLADLMQQIAWNEAPVTLSGGDPLFQPQAVAALVAAIKRDLGYNVWLYTGYSWEAIVANPELLQAVSQVDVVVADPFVLAQRDTQLLFRGSPNQRIIQVQPSLQQRQVVLWQPPVLPI